jgi:acetyl-CoA carboxylase carboxyl transferase subunit beta
MSLFDWFANRQKKDPELDLQTQNQPEREFPDGLWTKCTSCGAVMYTKDLRANQMVCLECDHHMPMDSNERIRQLIDANTWQAINEQVRPLDPLGFRDRKPYVDRVREMQDKTQLVDAVQTGLGKLDSHPLALAVMDFRFMGGSMGSVVGEKITRLIETATQQRIPVVVLCASGGARMQEGMLSLMQMAKISGALERHREEKLLYIPVLTHPTAGGVTASFAMLGDMILAEPKATIAFAGRRVVEQTIRAKLPDDFQTAEYLLDHGFVDMIVPRPQLRKTLGQLLALHPARATTPTISHTLQAPITPESLRHHTLELRES